MRNVGNKFCGSFAGAIFSQAFPYLALHGESVHKKTGSCHKERDEKHQREEVLL